METDSGIILPDGVTATPRSGDGSQHVAVWNETDLPSDVVQSAVETYFEQSSLAWGQPTTFQTYQANQGSLLARSEFTTPTNVIDEIKLAREMAERDDDIGATIGAMIATAFGDGMENFHEDEKTVAVFNGVAREANLDRAFKELYREYLISSQMNSASLFTRTQLEYTVNERRRTDTVATPMIGVLPAESIRVLDNDLFGTGTLAYLPEDPALCKWLEEFFDPKTTAARKAEMGRQDRVAANMFTGVVETSSMQAMDNNLLGQSRLYLLNPRMVQRTTMPKGSWKYPRPLLTRNFALLEAKRLLNIMDYALLQGGANFVVVAKKGSDDRPAQPAEIANLREVVRRASKTGVIVGDHRLDFDIITPKLDELLNASKRRLIGRKLAMALLRRPEHAEADSGSEGEKTDVELLSRVIASDRHDIKRHVERNIYGETVRRNPSLLTKGAAKLWFPKIVLQGSQYFTDFVLKLRDRGDIPRKWAVEAGGFDYEAGVQQRERELEAGDDDILIPGQVPHSSPEAGPQDNQPGRPPGGADDRPRQTITQNPGETVKAIYDESLDRLVRVGEVTLTVMEEYADYSVGRITSIEREALETGETVRRGSLVAVPVNPSIKVGKEKVLRLREGLSMVVGHRKGDNTVFAKVITFREPEFDLSDAETAVARWGWRDEAGDPISLAEPEDEPANVD